MAEWCRGAIGTMRMVVNDIALPGSLEPETKRTSLDQFIDAAIG